MRFNEQHNADGTLNGRLYRRWGDHDVCTFRKCTDSLQFIPCFYFPLQVKRKSTAPNARRNALARCSEWPTNIFTSNAFNVKHVRSHCRRADSFRKTMHIIARMTIRNCMERNVQHASNMLKVKWCRQWAIRTIRNASPAAVARSRSSQAAKWPIPERKCFARNAFRLRLKVKRLCPISIRINIHRPVEIWPAVQRVQRPSNTIKMEMQFAPSIRMHHTIRIRAPVVAINWKKVKL